MRFFTFCLVALLSALTVLCLVPHGKREASLQLATSNNLESLQHLERRKGGGGGGKGGGGGGSSAGKSGGSSSSSSGGKSGGTSITSNAGGRSSKGSGPRPSYGGGRYYGGGAAIPYTAGRASPRGLAPLLFLSLAALAFWPGWLFGAYVYRHNNEYTYFNQTSGQNETHPVKCLCQAFSVCGCDDNDDPEYLKSVIGNATPSALNDTLVRVADVNGTKTIWLNGTLPNGTTATGAAVPGARPNVVGWWVVGGAMAFALALL